jgi:hypothetical protein
MSTNLYQIASERLSPAEDACQNELLPSGTSRVHRLVVLAGQFRHYLQHHGVRASFLRVATFIAAKAAGTAEVEKKKAVWSEPAEYEVLDLQPGEMVEVKTEEEIRETLDQEGRNRGLQFTPDMTEYCGRRLRVFKRVQRICMEGRPGEMRSLNHTVILEGAICNGGSRSCDRACFFFWREAWLRRLG